MSRDIKKGNLTSANRQLKKPRFYNDEFLTMEERLVIKENKNLVSADLFIVFSDEGLRPDLESCDVSGQVPDIDVVVREDAHHTGIAPVQLIRSVTGCSCFRHDD